MKRTIVSKSAEALVQKFERLTAADFKRKVIADKHKIYVEGAVLIQKLREQMAKRLFWILIAELVVVHIIVLIQGFKIGGFDLRVTTIDVFIGATVVQIAAMITVIVRSLFPPGR